jgi:sigma-E factor negative regulatory protein RseC
MFDATINNQYFCSKYGISTVLMQKSIEHTGIINNIQGNLISVCIVQESACAGCHAKGVCSVSDKSEKIIEIENFDRTYKIGDEVIVFGNQGIGFQAVLLAFVLPFIIMLATLLFSTLYTSSEFISGITAISILVPYYLILSLFNKKHKSIFRFEIKRDFKTLV